jgi:hypothetical protein
LNDSKQAIEKLALAVCDFLAEYRNDPGAFTEERLAAIRTVAFCSQEAPSCQGTGRFFTVAALLVLSRFGPPTPRRRIVAPLERASPRKCPVGGSPSGIKPFD